MVTDPTLIRLSRRLQKTGRLRQELQIVRGLQYIIKTK